MTMQSRNEEHLDLVCDFPARETFRTSLLNHLMAVVADGNTSDQPAQPGPKIILLDDGDLNMLAVAEGDAKPPEPFDGKSG